jgi:hypothetical protein
VDLVCSDESKFPVYVYRTFDGALRYAKSMIRFGPSPAWILRIPDDICPPSEMQADSDSRFEHLERPITAVGAGVFKHMTTAAGVQLVKAGEAP